MQTIWVYLVLVLMSASESNSSDVATQMTLVNDDMKHCDLTTKSGMFYLHTETMVMKLILI